MTTYAVLSAAAWGAGAYLLHRYASSNRKGFEDFVNFEQTFIAAAHSLAVPMLIPPMRDAVVEIVKGGGYHTAPFLSAAFGVANYIYVGLIWFQTKCIIDAWQRSAERIHPLAGAVTLASSLCMHLIIPGSGYPFGVLFGIGLLLVERAPAASDPPGSAHARRRLSGVVLGRCMKCVAAAHNVFAFTNMPGAEVVAQVLRGGIVATAEINGLLDILYPTGPLGPIFGWSMHLYIGVIFWMCGDFLISWETDEPALPKSSILLGTLSSLVLWAQMPTSGFFGSAIVFGTALVDLRKAGTNKQVDKHE